ncbi:MAG: PD-(D/E)XK nuclease family protein [Actinomycetota bacterium]|nr:PD-(D/E)XK nuclease family protein [Actinomycetota bacterium]
MGLQVPGSITASKVSSFKECGLAFRLSVIDKIPQPITPWTLRGTLAHTVLDRLYFRYDGADRTRERALELAEEVWTEALAEGTLSGLDSTEANLDSLHREMRTLVLKDFEAEDPTKVKAIATELRLETSLGGVTLRGVIDRLDLNDDGSLTVTDYKTGKLPGEVQENERLSGVYFYALLCEKVLGQRPSQVQLVYLRDATRIVASPTEQALKGLTSRTEAVWRAVCNACEREDFRPRPSKLCRFCCYQELCPAQGGSLSLLETFKVSHGAQKDGGCNGGAADGFSN